MNDQVAELANRISRVEVPFGSGDDSLLEAHEVIAMSRLTGFTPTPTRIEQTKFEEEDVSALRAALLNYVERHSDHESRVTAYWALAALHDESELTLFRQLLRVEVCKPTVDDQVLWQLIIALDNIGEDVLEKISEADSLDGESRRAACRSYLLRHPS